MVMSVSDVLTSVARTQRMAGMARIASSAVGKLSVFMISDATCQAHNRPMQANSGAAFDSVARDVIMAATLPRRYRRSGARYRRRISGNGDRAAVRRGGAGAADRCRRSA